jgi:hypothetical protein
MRIRAGLGSPSRTYGQERTHIMKKLIVLVAIIAIAAFAFSKLSGQHEEHEFGS